MTALNDARPVLIVFADLAERPSRAGWYPEIDAARARLKGADLGLTLIENLSEQLRAFALTLPRGRFLADGKLDLDRVNREVVDRLLALRAADQPKGETGNPEPGAVTTNSLPKLVNRRRRMRRARLGPAAPPKRQEGKDENAAAGAQTTAGQVGAPRILAQPSKPTTSLANRPDRRPLPNSPISSTNSGPRSRSAAW